MKHTLERSGLSFRRRAALAFCLLFLSQSQVATGEEVRVTDGPGLRAAIVSALPGDRIVLMPGDYQMSKLVIKNGGRQGRPITVTALAPASTRIRSSVVELFKVRAPYWVFENLTFVGTDNTHHAFHLVRSADHLVLRQNRFIDFHSAIKGNPEGGRAADHVLIERNLFYNRSLRKTSAPTTPIDVLGGIGWVLRGNFIADFGRVGRNQISYGAFLKGTSKQGVIEGNLVMCEWRHSGGRRIGLSFGGGGSPESLRSARNSEHEDGIIRNNIILNCPNAPGIYLNRALNSKIYHNTIYNSYGIMARFPSGVSFVRNNIVSGAVTERSGAELKQERNLTTGWEIGTYVPGAALRLIHRVSDYDAKFPNWLDAEDVDWMQEKFRDLAAWLGRSSIGRGVTDFEDWFVAPGVGNLDLLEGEEILAKGLRTTDVKSDFCGHVRPDREVDLGAIEYRQGRCHLQAWIAELFQPFEDR